MKAAILPLVLLVAGSSAGLPVLQETLRPGMWLELEDHRTGARYQPYMARDWDLALPTAGLPGPSHTAWPLLPTGETCLVDTGQRYTARIAGLHPGQTYLLTVWYGVGVGHLNFSYSYWYEIGRIHALRDGTAALPVDLGRHRPEPDVPGVFLIIWQPADDWYWSAEFGWLSAGESGEPGCLV